MDIARFAIKRTNREYFKKVCKSVPEFAVSSIPDTQKTPNRRPERPRIEGQEIPCREIHEKGEFWSFSGVRYRSPSEDTSSPAPQITTRIPVIPYMDSDPERLIVSLTAPQTPSESAGNTAQNGTGRVPVIFYLGTYSIC